MTMPFIKKISIIFILFTITICSGETIGRVMKASGEVLIKPIGSGTYSVSVKLGQAISNGDAIRVGEASFAVVIFLDDKSVVKIKENTGSEILGIITHDTIEKFEEKAFQIDVSKKNIQQVVEKVLEVISKKEGNEEVDWLNLVTKNNDLEKFFTH